MENRGRKIKHVKDVFPSPSSRPRTLRQSSSSSSVGGSPLVPRSPAGDPRRLLPDLPMHDGSPPMISPVISPLASPQTYGSSPLEVSANEAYSSQPKRGVPSVPIRSFDQTSKRRAPIKPTSPLSMSSNGLPTVQSPIITGKTTCITKEASISLSDESSSDSSSSDASTSESPVFTRMSFAEKLSSFQNSCGSSRPSSQLLKNKTTVPLPPQNISQPSPPQDIPQPSPPQDIPQASTPQDIPEPSAPQDIPEPSAPQDIPVPPRELPLPPRESPLPSKYTSQTREEPQLFSYDCLNYGGDFLPNEIDSSDDLRQSHSMTRSLKAGSTGTTGSTGSESSQSERCNVSQELDKFPGSEDFGEYLDDDDENDKEMRIRRVNNIHELRRSQSHKVRDSSMIGRMLNRILKRSSSHASSKKNVSNITYMDSKLGQADSNLKNEYDFHTIHVQKQS